METSEFVTTINSLQWNLNFHKFCEILDINPGDDNNYQYSYAIEKFNALAEVTKSMNKLGNDNIEKLIEYYRSTHRNVA